MTVFPKISIITPSLNQGRFIEETIKSVISQEGDFLIEYIVMDGGSTDSSVEIIKKYERLLNEGRLEIKCRGIEYRWVTEKDKGQADAVDKGFRAAQGGIFAWINSDDAYVRGALKKAMDFFEGHPEFDVFYGTSDYIDEDGRISGRYPAQEFDMDKMAEANLISQPSAFFRRGAYMDSGGLVTTLSYAMDYDLWFRLAKRSRFAYSPEVLSYYRLHGGSKTISEEHVLANNREVLDVVIRHSGRAPLNRVYAYCQALLKYKLPRSIGRVRLFLILTNLFCTLITCLRLNKGISKRDLQMISLENLKKTIYGWRAF